MEIILWLIAVALVLYGLYALFVQKQVLLGIVLIIVGLLVGPGGVSIFDDDDGDEDLSPVSVVV